MSDFGPHEYRSAPRRKPDIDVAFFVAGFVSAAGAIAITYYVSVQVGSFWLLGLPFVGYVAAAVAAMPARNAHLWSFGMGGFWCYAIAVALIAIFVLLALGTCMISLSNGSFM